MSDPTNPSKSDDLMPAKIIYALYAAGYFVGITVIAGVIYAYTVKRGNPVCDSHLRFQIRTFWLSLAIFLVGTILTIIGVGVLILLFVTVWGLGRVISGFLILNEGKPIGHTQYAGMLAKAG